MYFVDQLFKDQNSEHILIQNKGGKVTSFEIFPQVQFHAKITIEKGACSPVVLSLSFANDKPINDLYIYGSFKVKKPTINSKLVVNAKNTSRLVIAEPHGKLSFGAECVFYLTFETLQTTTVLSVKSQMRVLKTQDKKKDLQEVVAGSLLGSSKQKQPMTKQEVFKAKLMAEVKRALEDAERRELIWEKMEFLQKKKKLLGQLNSDKFIDINEDNIG